MTMMDPKLVRLDGNENWQELGDDWESQLNVLFSLSFVIGWSSPPGSITRTREGRQLDWGAWLYEVTKAELLDLIEPRPGSEWNQREWDVQHARLIDLPEDGRYGVVWTECY